MIFTVLILAQAQNCLKTECTNLSGSTCYQTSDVVQVKSCSSSQICNVNRMYSTQTLNLQLNPGTCVSDTYLEGSKTPGEYCESNQECRSSNCEKGICKGFALGEPCNFPADCDIGMSCSDQGGFCKLQVNAGEDCNTFEDCDNGSGCFNSVCRGYLTLSTGSKFFANNINIDPMLCSSGYLSDDLTCQSAPTNQKSANSACESNDDCKLSNGTIGECSCGLNESGEAFCKTAEGDEEYQSYASSLRSIILINQNCHTTLRFSRRCPALNGTSEVNNYLRSYYIQMYRHLLINADQCVVDLVNPLASDYKHVKNAGGGSSSDDNIDLVIIIVCVSIGGVTLLIFACWLCAKKCPIFLVRPEFEQGIETADQALQIASTRLVKQARGHHKSKFTINEFVMIPKTLGHIEIGIPIGVMVDEESYEPKENQYFPLANAENGLDMQDMEDSVSDHKRVKGFEDSREKRL